MDHKDSFNFIVDGSICFTFTAQITTKKWLGEALGIIITIFRKATWHSGITAYTMQVSKSGISTKPNYSPMSMS